MSKKNLSHYPIETAADSCQEVSENICVLVLNSVDYNISIKNLSDYPTLMATYSCQKLSENAYV